MPISLLVLPILVLLQSQPSGIQRLTLPIPDSEPLRYALSLPRKSDRNTRLPVVLALHPGGPRTPYYGAAFVEQIIAPAFAGIDAIMVAPDCPTGSWADPAAERAVQALMTHVRTEFAVDDRRVLVTGFSLGARGAWFYSAHYPSQFTGTLVVAGSTGNEPIETLARMPTYVIHSRKDEVVSFAPTEQAVRELERLKRDVHFEALDDLGHYDTAKYIPAITRGARWVFSRWARQ